MAENESNRCEKHDVDIGELPDDYNFCPFCRRLANREARIREQTTRDPTREPY